MMRGALNFFFLGGEKLRQNLIWGWVGYFMRILTGSEI